MNNRVCLLITLAALANLATFAGERACQPGAEDLPCREEIKSANQRRGLETGGTVTFKKLIVLPGQSMNRALACNANISISYTQMNERIRVKTSIDHEDCAASSGEYRLRIRTRDEALELHTVEISKSWAREKNAVIELTEYYDIGADVDLVSLRIKQSPKKGCTCKDESLID